MASHLTALPAYPERPPVPQDTPSYPAICKAGLTSPDSNGTELSRYTGKSTGYEPLGTQWPEKLLIFNAYRPGAELRLDYFPPLQPGRN